MPHNYNFADDLSCVVTHENGLYEIELAAHNPLTLDPWGDQDDVIGLIESGRFPSQWWVEIASKPTQEQIDAITAIDKRIIRNQLLAESDWTQVNDSPLDNATKVLWATYRSSLRSLPEHENWPNLEDADWPTLEDEDDVEDTDASTEPE
jgi:hypothetical protein